MNEPEFFSTAELTAKKSGTFVFDVESFHNYFLVAFKCIETGKLAYFEAVDNELVPIDWIAWMLDNFCLVGFNCKKYDLPVIGVALAGYNVAQLKEATEDIILNDMHTGDLQKKYKFAMPKTNDIDLIEVAPLRGSLKLYAARLHCKYLQDLPFDPSTVLTREQIAIVRTYCFNDLENTCLLLSSLNEQLELRSNISAEFQQDMRSRSDTQIGQEIIVSEITRIVGKPPRRQDFTKRIGESFLYTAPAYIQFHLPQLQSTLYELTNNRIAIGSSGHVVCPPKIREIKTEIAGKLYVVGMGGLHSTETRQTITNETNLIIDRDVTGYYPNLIWKNNFSTILGEHEAIENIIARRTNAKKIGDKVTADTMKIVCNGAIFGKKSDPYSLLYDPENMVATTLTGQLSLMMQIERLTMADFVVMSANTDGVVTICPQFRYEEFCAILRQWEIDTGLETEETQYKGLYSRDVNNYIVLKMDGKFKLKGVYAEVGSALNSPLSKNPENQICVDAVCNHIKNKTPLMDTIIGCKDIRKFLRVRQVTGGAQKNGRYLGKVIRWYYASGTVGDINYCVSGNKVPMSDGGKPLMMLPDHLPQDIDYERYVGIATEILEDIGYQPKKNEQLRLEIG